jgi:hypothetical protein
MPWNNRINKLQHKLDALAFHMKNFNQHQNEVLYKLEKEYVNSIIEFEEIDPIFVFEVGSFCIHIPDVVIIKIHFLLQVQKVFMVFKSSIIRCLFGPSFFIRPSCLRNSGGSSFTLLYMLTRLCMFAS